MQQRYRWQDWTNAILGVWLFMSPWVFPNATGVANVNAWIFGAAICLVSLWALGRPRSQQPEAMNIVFGVWTFFAPWLLGFASAASGAAWNGWIIGAVVTILAMTALLPMITRTTRLRA